MNNVFDFKRLLLVLNKDIQENWKRYALQFVTMSGVIAVVITFMADDKYSNIAAAVAFQPDLHGVLENLNRDLLMISSFLFMAFGVVVASTLMEPMNNKARRISYLSVPASNVEKVFSRWLIVTIGYGVAFFVALWLADAVRVAICSFNYPALNVHFMDLGKLIRPDDASSGHGYMLQSSLFYLFLSLYFVAQSIFILGATFWEKASFVKTFSVGVILVIFFVLICRWSILSIYGDFHQFESALNSFRLFEDYTIAEKTRLLTWTFSLITLFNWTLAFLRFKESEVIKRF